MILNLFIYYYSSFSSFNIYKASISWDYNGKPSWDYNDINLFNTVHFIFTFLLPGLVFNNFEDNAMTIMYIIHLVKLCLVALFKDRFGTLWCFIASFDLWNFVIFKYLNI